MPLTVTKLLHVEEHKHDSSKWELTNWTATSEKKADIEVEFRHIDIWLLYNIRLLFDCFPWWSTILVIPLVSKNIISCNTAKRTAHHMNLAIVTYKVWKFFNMFSVCFVTLFTYRVNDTLAMGFCEV
jgi:hypothetical protein